MNSHARSHPQMSSSMITFERLKLPMLLAMVLRKVRLLPLNTQPPCPPPSDVPVNQRIGFHGNRPFLSTSVMNATESAMFTRSNLIRTTCSTDSSHSFRLIPKTSIQVLRTRIDQSLPITLKYQRFNTSLGIAHRIVSG